MGIIKLRIIPIIEKGGRVITKQRKIIYDVIMMSEGHLTADEVYWKAKETEPSIAVGTVYRNLKLMVEDGEIQKISIASGADKYDKNPIHHDHMICKKCGKVLDAFFHDLQAGLQKQVDVKVLDYDLNIQCICKECEEAEK